MKLTQTIRAIAAVFGLVIILFQNPAKIPSGCDSATGGSDGAAIILVLGTFVPPEKDSRTLITDFGETW
jgi:hypothetical protein